MNQTLENLTSYLTYARIRIVLEAEQPARLPSYKGSTLRGALGDAMRRLVCRYPGLKECTECRLYEQCPYAAFHENALEPGHPLRKLYPKLPQPYIIEPLDQGETQYKAGDSLVFQVVLAGRALAQYPLLVQSLIELRNTGIGRGQYPFKLAGIFSQNPDGQMYPLGWGDLPASLSWNGLPDILKNKTFTLEFLTPVYLKMKGGEARPGQPEFWLSLANRLTWLATLYCGMPMPADLPFRQLSDMPDCLADETEKIRWTRISGRQKASMQFGGYTGKVTFSGGHPVFRNLAALGENLHVGGQATFGQGHYRILHP